ncbi:hypothetical protein [Natronorubrum halophilum]|uniref:hypothetical protein n=1 Tax=Natronorubrum halophilum TaxID=1702106 RepID=UPI000EF6C2FC|nr:hypothetical protein [Natronorubrum halophilum]
MQGPTPETRTRCPNGHERFRGTDERFTANSKRRLRDALRFASGTPEDGTELADVWSGVGVDVGGTREEKAH